MLINPKISIEVAHVLCGCPWFYNLHIIKCGPYAAIIDSGPIDSPYDLKHYVGRYLLTIQYLEYYNIHNHIKHAKYNLFINSVLEEIRGRGGLASAYSRKLNLPNLDEKELKTDEVWDRSNISKHNEYIDQCRDRGFSLLLQKGSTDDPHEKTYGTCILQRFHSPSHSDSSCIFCPFDITLFVPSPSIKYDDSESVNSNSISILFSHPTHSLSISDISSIFSCPELESSFRKIKPALTPNSQPFKAFFSGDIVCFDKDASIKANTFFSREEFRKYGATDCIISSTPHHGSMKYSPEFYYRIMRSSILDISAGNSGMYYCNYIRDWLQTSRFRWISANRKIGAHNLTSILEYIDMHESFDLRPALIHSLCQAPPVSYLSNIFHDEPKNDDTGMVAKHLNLSGKEEKKSFSDEMHKEKGYYIDRLNPILHTGMSDRDFGALIQSEILPFIKDILKLLVEYLGLKKIEVFMVETWIRAYLDFTTFLDKEYDKKYIVDYSDPVPSTFMSQPPYIFPKKLQTEWKTSLSSSKSYVALLDKCLENSIKIFKSRFSVSLTHDKDIGKSRESEDCLRIFRDHIENFERAMSATIWNICKVKKLKTPKKQCKSYLKWLETKDPLLLPLIHFHTFNSFHKREIYISVKNPGIFVRRFSLHCVKDASNEGIIGMDRHVCGRWELSKDSHNGKIISPMVVLNSPSPPPEAFQVRKSRHCKKDKEHYITKYKKISKPLALAVGKLFELE
ncbi:hypothetical protein ADUPG1_012726 [Aduncisulcus paluster]|uniref:Uncharacterized protein n=1 Tax=Aduncisulcus paluster TaxID=2918883 RepID=A0ABQ5K447_9EUKA|nr:hypothetical protein ADUPG1_012726 [Aduncisulcus paluster]